MVQRVANNSDSKCDRIAVAQNKEHADGSDSMFSNASDATNATKYDHGCTSGEERRMWKHDSEYEHLCYVSVLVSSDT